MAIATQALDPKTELHNLNVEYGRLAKTLETHQKALSELQRERAGIAEAVAEGREKPARVGEIERRLEESRAAVDGADALMRRVNKRMNDLRPLVQRQDAAENRATRLAEAAKINAEGEAAAARINQKLREILEVELPAFDAARYRLARDYSDNGIGGAGLALALVKLLFTKDKRPAAEAPLVNAGWKRRSDVQLAIHNLFKPVDMRFRRR